MLNVQRIGGRSLSRLLALILTLAIGATVGLAGAGQADADTPDRRISHVSLNLTGTAGTDQARDYSDFLRGVQGAAAHGWGSGIGQTQGNADALLRVDITFHETLQLWITPNNMYLRGFTTPNGLTFAFNDYPLQQVMADFAAAHSPDARLLPPPDGIRPLPYSSGYIDMVRAAGRDRTNTPMSYASLLNSLATLRVTQQPDQNPNVARSLLFFIQYVSEAARFRPVAAMMLGVMNGSITAPGVPAGLQELENDWSALSAWAYDLRTGNTPPPLNVGPHYGTVNSYRQLRAAVMLLLGALNQAPPPGDFKHDEV